MIIAEGSPIHDSRRRRVFVGRRRELGELTQAWTDAVRGHGQAFLISGDAGIGKTRLAEELAEHATDGDGSVVWARCWEDPGPPPYWPWLQVVRACLGDDVEPPTDLLSHFLPELSPRGRDPGQEPSSPQMDAGAVRFRLFDAVRTFALSVARRRPLVLVFDDLQWSDIPSLRLLDFFAGAVSAEPVLLIGMYREIEGHVVPELANALAALGRHSRPVPLRGLDAHELAELVRETYDSDPPSDVLSALWELTEGNPFFTDEIVRLFLAEGHSPETPGEFVVPQGVQEVIRRRLDPLGEGTRRILRHASVLGREFDVTVLEHVLEVPAAEVLRAFADTDRYGVLQEIDPHTYRFTHALIREALYEEQSPEDRARSHLRAGRVLEGLFGGGVDDHLAELAHHFVEAGSLAEPGEAARYVMRAGRVAFERLDYEQAAAQYITAVGLLEVDAGRDERDLIEVLLAVGEAQRRSGSVREAMKAFRRAADRARGASLVEAFVRAAVGFEDARLRAGNYAAIPEALVLLQEALNLVGEGDQVLRAEILSRRPQVLQFIGAPSAEMVPAALEAVEIAEGSGDDRLLVRTLEGLRWAYWDPEHADERLSIADRIIRTARDAGDTEAALMGNLFKFIDLFTLGRAEELEAQIVILEGGAKASGQPWFEWWPSALRATWALLRGALDEALEEATVVETVATMRRDQMASAVAAFLLAGRAWEAGDTSEAQRVLDVVAGIVPLPVFRSTARAFVAVLGDRHEEAERCFEEVARKDFTDIPQGAMWLPLVAVTASVCGYLGDVERARQLYALLEPVPKGVVLVPPVAGYLSVPHWLGVLAATAGLEDDAERHFEEALSFHAGLGAWAWLARTRYEYGRMLVARGGSTDTERGFLLLRGARELAESLGMRTVAERSAEALEGPAERSAEALEGPEVPPEPVRPDGQSVFRREGEVWRLAFAGRTVQVKDSKGLRYLQAMLQQPGEEIHVLRLLTLVDAGGGASGVSVADAQQSGLAVEVQSSEATLDAEAKEAYRQRLLDLHEEIDEADALGDAERAARARQEVDWIAQEVSRAIGLYGRDRRSGTEAERARVNVQRAVRTAMDRVQEVHPELGEHLRALVRTGTYCSYVSDPKRSMDWTL